MNFARIKTESPMESAFLFWTAYFQESPQWSVYMILNSSYKIKRKKIKFGKFLSKKFLGNYSMQEEI